MYIRSLNIEFEILKSTKAVDSAQAAAAASHKDWLDTKSAIPKRLSGLFSFQKGKQRNEENIAFQQYYYRGEAWEGDHQVDLMQVF